MCKRIPLDALFPIHTGTSVYPYDVSNPNLMFCGDGFTSQFLNRVLGTVIARVNTCPSIISSTLLAGLTCHQVPPYRWFARRRARYAV